MRHLRQKMGIITAIPVANDVNRDEALIRTPIPAANGGNRYEATMSISEELQRQNERLELLLNLTTRITSSLNLREVLRAIAANIREVIHADAVPGELVRCQGSAQCHIVTEAKQQFANHRVFPELVVCLDCRPQNFLCRKLNCANLRKSMPLKFGCLILGPR